jgi:alkanesulfonate monooxygenase SsuD/methylene tetrahydromethanopterin reductase-like flavin-dependent oxidoreductase (luciferase family)
VTERLQVGLGILPAVARTAAVTAMEISTLCRLAPGRVLPGIGHGVQSWMAQMGVRTPSPLTTLEEVITVVTRLLAGERVTFDGREVYLDDVALDQPPAEPPPILAGCEGPKSIALAGRVAGGVVLAGPAPPAYARLALEQAGHPDGFHVAVFSTMCITPDRSTAHGIVAPLLDELLASPPPGLQALPFFDELVSRHAELGVDGLVTMPDEWWAEIGPIGTLDDAIAHVGALEDAGVRSIGLYPAPDVDIARSQVGDVLALARR